ncbi:hypothetical protein PIB30_068644, partial [Stylosanthes scabra]|nr:hypothetical protein [Stylosanthes scabra]
QPPFQQQPPHFLPQPPPKPPQHNSVEATLEKLTLSTVGFEQSTNNFIEEARVNFKNHGEAIRNLEVQMGEISKQLAQRPPNVFPSDTIMNPRGECKAISVKMVEEAPEERQEAVVETKRIR